MSAIPPNWLASGIQAQGAQRRAIDDRDRDIAAQTRAGGADTFSRELIDGVENSDRDSQADADAEGSGSQGKSHSEAARDEDAPPREQLPPTTGLDIEA